MKNIFIILFVIVFFASNANAQLYYKFSGIVQDSSSGDFIPFAQIVDSANRKFTETDQFGRFSILLKKGNYQFTVSYVGYPVKLINLLMDQDVNQTIKINSITLPELVIQGTPSLKIENGYIDISPEKLKSIPTLLGEKDVLKALSILPGVAPGNDGTNQFSVRGGGYDQNLVLIDGSVLYNTSHFFGFLSAIDPFAIKSLRLYKDGFPVEFGGKLSSVVDIKLKEGNFNKPESYVNVGIMTSSLGVQGPIKKEKLSFLLSSRIAYPGLITLPFKKSYEKDNRNSFVSYFMYDLVAKMSLKLNNLNSMYLSGTAGKDFLLTGNKENNYRTNWNINWGNSVLAFRYNGIFSRSIDINFTLNYNNYKYKSILQGTELISNYKSNILNQSAIKDLKAGMELNWNLLPSIDITTGSSFTKSSIVPVIKFFDLGTDTSSSIEKFSSTEFSIYQNMKTKLSKYLNLNVGYRYSIYNFKKNNFDYFQPRVSLSYQFPNKKLDLYLSYSKMYQPIHLLLNPSNGYINEVWLSANSKLLPQQMNEKTVGIHMKKNWGDLRLAFFERNFTNLIELKDNIKFLKFFSSDWSDLFETNGNGRSTGVEFSYMTSIKKLNILTSYTNNHSKRVFSNINEGRAFASPVDRPHVLSVNADYVKNEKSTLTIGLTYFSGNPITLPEYYIRTSSLQQYAYADRYNTRLPAYKRVDIGYKKSYTNSKGLPKEWTFSVYNLLFNRNIIQVVPATVGISTPGNPSISIGERPYFEGRSFFAFIPGINFYYKFK